MVKAKLAAIRDLALARVKAGEAQGKVAKSLGVSEAAVSKWVNRLTKASAAAVPAVPVPEALKPLDSSGLSDFEKAMRAAGIPTAGAIETPSHDAPVRGIPTCPPGYMLVDGQPVKESDALVSLVEMVNTTAVKLYATLNGVKIDKALEKELSLSPGERAELALTAPYAVPFVRKFLDQVEVVGALVFAGAVVCIVGARLAQIKERIPKKIKPAPGAADKPAAQAAVESPALDTSRKGTGAAVPDAIPIPGLDRPIQMEDWSKHGIAV